MSLGANIPIIILMVNQMGLKPRRSRMLIHEEHEGHEGWNREEHEGWNHEGHEDREERQAQCLAHRPSSLILHPSVLCASALNFCLLPFVGLCSLFFILHPSSFIFLQALVQSWG